MAVSKRTRFEVLRRDNYTCRYCGGRAPDVELTVDHVTPTTLGGTDDPPNLVAACRDCNAGKASSSPDAALVADVNADALRWAAAVRQAAQDVDTEQRAAQERLDPFLARWGELLPSYRRSNTRYQLPADWETTISGLLDAGLSQDQLVRAVEVALTSGAERPFRYLVGVANNMLAELHERARRILDEEGG